MNSKSRIALLCLLLTLSTEVNATGTFTALGITLAPTISGSTLTLKVTGTNKGYIGLGFGSDMKNVDMIMITASGSTVSVVDSYSTSNSTPTPDTTNDTTLTTGTYSSTDGVWDVTFTRPLTGTEATDAVISTTGSQTFAIAIGSSMDTSQQHSKTSVFKMNFSDATQSVASGNLLSFGLISLISGILILI